MHCARCDTDLAAAAIQGMCPVCLFDAALPNESGEAPGSFHYDLIEEIARGGMGVVYRAVQHGSQRQVALKMIRSEQLETAGARERFRSEVEAVASLDHPNLLPIYETGEFEGAPFYSMKFASAGDLREHAALYRDQFRAIAQLLATVARAVQHAHERGLLHRDLKPANILLDGDGRAPYVSDFGIAKWLQRDSSLTIASATLGTPHYIAPEQAAGSSTKLTPAADVYSLGAILYELLTGSPPFVADTALETLKLVTEMQPRAPRRLNLGVPRDLELICLKCLAKEPGARYSSALALAEDLERWLAGDSIAARPARLMSKTSRWIKRNRALSGLSAALAIALATIGIFTYRQSARSHLVDSLPNDNSIAVLPFEDASPAHDQEYFCEGISEEVLAALTKIEDLRVVARASSFSFKGKDTDVTEIGRQLHVANLLRGTLRRDGNRIRLTVHVVETRSGTYRWSETYERELRDVFVVQNEITRTIAESLKVKLTAVPASVPARDLEAYDLYLRGLYFSNKSTEEDLRKSLSFFQAALDKDPTFARAWSGIAKAWNWLADEYVKPLEAYPISQAAALKALALDEGDAEAHVYLGEAERVLRWDYQAEEDQLRRALEIDPNSAAAHTFLALLLAAKHSDAEALAQLQAAKQSDPLSPWVGIMAVEISLSTGQLDPALEEAKRMVRLDPNFSYFDDTLGAAYRERGQLSEAISIYEKAASISHVPRSGLAIAYARAGRVDDARRVLAQLMEQSRTQYVDAEAIASVYVALGDNDEAFRWIDRAIADHAAPLEGIGRRNIFVPLHSDPRFAEVLRRVGLSPENE